MSSQNNPVNSKEVAEFVSLSKEYCELVETIDTTSLEEFVSKAHEMLLKLYMKAVHLPELDARYEDLIEHSVTEKEYEKNRRKINEKLGHYDSYHDINSPIRQTSGDPSDACISEDMSDIFQEIKDFSMLYNKGRKDLMHEAIWECKQSFKNYWGQRLTNSLRALHFLRYSAEKLEELLENEIIDNEDLNIDDIDTSEWIVSEG